MLLKLQKFLSPMQCQPYRLWQHAPTFTFSCFLLPTGTVIVNERNDKERSKLEDPNQGLEFCMLANC